LVAPKEASRDDEGDFEVKVPSEEIAPSGRKGDTDVKA